VQKLSKLGGDHEKAGNFIFVGFGDHTDVVKYYDGKNRVIRESRNVVWVEPSSRTLVDVQLEGELGKPSKQSPTEKSAQPVLVEGHHQPTVPEGEQLPAQMESQQNAQTASQQHAQTVSQQHTQTPSQLPSTPPKATSTSTTHPAQIEDAPSLPIRRSSRPTNDIDYRKLNNPAARGPRLPLPVPSEEGEMERAEYAFLGEGILEATGAPRTYNEALKSSE
jgi:hypothetical protein